MLALMYASSRLLLRDDFLRCELLIFILLSLSTLMKMLMGASAGDADLLKTLRISTLFNSYQ